MDNTIVVLGNGFDLDLGLKTSYSDFMYHLYTKNPDDICEKNVLVKSLLNVWVKNGEIQKKYWIDIEKQLRDWILNPDEKDNPIWENKNIKSDYDAFVRELNYYMLVEKYPPIDEFGNTYKINSCALQLLKFMSNAECNFQIFSLNYTNLLSITDVINKRLSGESINLSGININNIHGIAEDISKTEEPHIIIGIDENCKVPDKFDFLIKTNNRNYKGGILSSISQASHLILFGVGMGITDWPYFKNSFHDIIEKNNNLKAYIFTNESKSEYLKKISQMTEIPMSKVHEANINEYNTSDKKSFTSFLNDYNKYQYEQP